MYSAFAVQELIKVAPWEERLATLACLRVAISILGHRQLAQFACRGAVTTFFTMAYLC